MLVRSLIYGWGFDFMRPFQTVEIRTLLLSALGSDFFILLKRYAQYKIDHIFFVHLKFYL